MEEAILVYYRFTILIYNNFMQKKLQRKKEKSRIFACDVLRLQYKYKTKVDMRLELVLAE